MTIRLNIVLISVFIILIRYTASGGCDCYYLGESHCGKGDKCDPCKKNPECSHIDSSSKCTNGVCSKSCSKHSDCFKYGGYCNSGSCALCTLAANQCQVIGEGYNCMAEPYTGYLKCYACFKNSHCLITRYCDDGVCKSCTQNSQCDSKICYNGKCGCVSNTNCTSNTPYCNTATGFCGGCRNDGDCSLHPSTPFCEVSSGKCRECRSNANCTGALPFCSSGTCSKCSQNSDCSTNSYCEKVSGSCVKCVVDSHCSSNAFNKSCKASGNICVQCRSNNNCTSTPLTPYCKSDICAGCLSNSDCTPPMTCNMTVKYCMADQCGLPGKFCNSSLPICDNVRKLCGPCTSDAQCGAFNSSLPYCVAGACAACRSVFDCTSVGGACATGICANCNTDSDCSPLFCNTTTNMCQRSQCPCTGSTPLVCVGGFCTSCSNHTQCEANYPSNPFCSSSLGLCVNCIADRNCSNTQFCNTTGCSPKVCLNSALCSNSTPICEPKTGCQICTSDAECISERNLPFCTLTGTCASCLSDSDCSGQASICDNGFCRQCSSDIECGIGKVCSPVRGCVSCYSDQNCSSTPSLPFCHSYTCTGCYTDAECSPNYCNAGSGVCVQCNTNSQCNTSTPICRGNTCQGCLADIDCAPQECDVTTGKCTMSECTNLSPCMNITKAACVNKFCAKCRYDNDCSQFNKTKLCSNTGVCVECIDSAQCSAIQPDILRNCINQTCEPCPGNCTTCSNSSYCQICFPGFNFFRGQCYLGCVPGKVLEGGNCIDKCGDGIKSLDLPYCDDNNTISGDGCSSSCQVETGWRCINGGVDSKDECYLLPTFTVIQGSEMNEFLVVFSNPMTYTTNLTNLLNITLPGIDSSLYKVDMGIQNPTTISLKFTVEKTVRNPDLKISMLDNTKAYDPNNSTVNGSSFHFTIKSLKYFPASSAKATEAMSKGAGAAAAASLAASTIIIAISSNPAIIWALVNLMQVFYYLLFINVDYPQNVQDFLKIFSIGSFSFLPNPIQIVVPNINDININVPEKFNENNLNGLFLGNAGSQLLIWGVACSLSIVSYLLVKYLRRMPSLLGLVATRVADTMLWSGFLRTWITSYMDLSVFGLLQMYDFSFKSKLYLNSSLLALITVFANAIFPIWMYMKVNREKKRLHSKTNRFNSIVEEFKEDEFSMFFNVFLLARRFFTAFALVFLGRFVYLQIFVLLCLNFTHFFNLMMRKPYLVFKDFLTNTVTEFSFLVIHFTIVIVAYDNESSIFSPDQQINIGWLIIAACCVTLLVAMAFILLEAFNGLKIAFFKIKLVIFKEKRTKFINKQDIKSSPEDINLEDNNPDYTSVANIDSTEINGASYMDTNFIPTDPKINSSELSSPVKLRRRTSSEDLSDYFNKLSKSILKKSTGLKKQ